MQATPLQPSNKHVKDNVLPRTGLLGSLRRVLVPGPGCRAIPAGPIAWTFRVVSGGRGLPAMRALAMTAASFGRAG